MTTTPTKAPTHERARQLAMLCTATHSPMKRAELLAYIRASESNAARIEELERENAELREFKGANLRRALEQK